MSGSLATRLASFTGRVALATIAFGIAGYALHGSYDLLLAGVAEGMIRAFEAGGSTVLDAMPGGIRIRPANPALDPWVFRSFDPHLSAPLFLAILAAGGTWRGPRAWLARLSGGFLVLLAIHLAGLVIEVEFRPLIAAGYRTPTYYVYRFVWWVVGVWSILLLPAGAAIYVYLADWSEASGRPAHGRRWLAAMGAGALVLLIYTAGVVRLRPADLSPAPAPGVRDVATEAAPPLPGAASPVDAIEAFRAGRYEEAARRFERLLAANPEDHAARHSLGVALYRIARFDDAIRELEAVARARPDHPGLDVSLGAALYDLGRFDEALEAFDRADLTGVDEPDLLLQVGGTLYAAGRLDGAERAYDRLLAVQPDNPVALFNLGNVSMAQGRDREAVQRFEAAAVRNPTPELHNNLGVLHARAGRTDAAVGSYRAALALDPADAVANFNLGRLLARGSDRCAALPHFRRCATGGNEALAARCFGLAEQLAGMCGG